MIESQHYDSMAHSSRVWFKTRHLWIG